MYAPSQIIIYSTPVVNNLVQTTGFSGWANLATSVVGAFAGALFAYMLNTHLENWKMKGAFKNMLVMIGTELKELSRVVKRGESAPVEMYPPDWVINLDFFDSIDRLLLIRFNAIDLYTSLYELKQCALEYKLLAKKGYGDDMTHNAQLQIATQSLYARIRLASEAYNKYLAGNKQLGIVPSTSDDLQT